MTMKKSHSELDELSVGVSILFDLYGRPDVRQLLLIEGPNVLGWAEWTAIQEPTVLELLRHALQHWADEKLIEESEIKGLCQAIWGAVIQSALACAADGGKLTAKASYVDAIQLLIAGLRERGEARAR